MSPPLQFAFPNHALTDYERHAFDYFVLETAGPPWIIFLSKDWIQLALQMSQEEPTVLLAVVAVGSVHSFQQTEFQVTHHTLSRLPISGQTSNWCCSSIAKQLLPYKATSTKLLNVERMLSLCCYVAFYS